MRTLRPGCPAPVAATPGRADRHGDLQERQRELAGLAGVLGSRKRVVDQVAGLATAELDPAAKEPLVEQAIDHRRLEGHVDLLAVVGEDPDTLLARRTLGVHLVAHAAQERLIDEIRGLEVDGEDDEDRERHFELLAGLQRQEVLARLEGHQPAVSIGLHQHPDKGRRSSDLALCALLRQFSKTNQRPTTAIPTSQPPWRLHQISMMARTAAKPPTTMAVSMATRITVRGFEEMLKIRLTPRRP